MTYLGRGNLFSTPYLSAMVASFNLAVLLSYPEPTQDVGVFSTDVLFHRH